MPAAAGRLHGPGSRPWMADGPAGCAGTRMGRSARPGAPPLQYRLSCPVAGSIPILPALPDVDCVRVAALDPRGVVGCRTPRAGTRPVAVPDLRDDHVRVVPRGVAVQEADVDTAQVPRVRLAQLRVGQERAIVGRSLVEAAVGSPGADVPVSPTAGAAAFEAADVGERQRRGREVVEAGEKASQESKASLAE